MAAKLPTKKLHDAFEVWFIKMCKANGVAHEGQFALEVKQYCWLAFAAGAQTGDK